MTWTNQTPQRRTNIVDFRARGVLLSLWFIRWGRGGRWVCVRGSGFGGRGGKGKKRRGYRSRVDSQLLKGFPHRDSRGCCSWIAQCGFETLKVGKNLKPCTHQSHTPIQTTSFTSRVSNSSPTPKHLKHSALIKPAPPTSPPLDSPLREPHQLPACARRQMHTVHAQNYPQTPNLNSF